MFIVVAETRLNFRPGTLDFVEGGYPLGRQSDPMPYWDAMKLMGEWMEIVESPGWKFRIDRVATVASE